MAPHPRLPILSSRRSGMAQPTHEISSAGERPAWLRVTLSNNETYRSVEKLVHDNKLHTVCESASCPNIGECWANRALTIMILGNVCTRSCGFCDVATGRPGPVDLEEPLRVAEVLSKLDLRYTVITSVDRDDLPDGGASIWAQTITEVRKTCPGMEIEVLVPDFKGDKTAISTVVTASPNVYAHNIETVERLHRPVRPQAKYQRSLDTLAHARALGAVTKSGIMLGLGEEDHEVLATLRDLANSGVEVVNLGQYLRPSLNHLPVKRWVTPEQFAFFKSEGEKMGFAHVESGPLVRSSYRADQQAAAAKAARNA